MQAWNVIDTLAEYYGVELPVFVDNAVCYKADTDTRQVIRLVVSEPDKTLRFERGRQVSMTRVHPQF